jgi:hypothetical protein
MVNPKRFYTYAYLREDRTPYYIGKGSGRRYYSRKKTDIKPPKDKTRVILLKQNLTEEEAFKHEIYMISVFGRKDIGTGILHNKSDGGEGPSNFSEEALKKISEASKNRIYSEKTRRKKSKSMTGKFHSEETKKKIRESKKNISKETREKISKCGKGRLHTEETKEKIRQANIGKKLSEETKRKMKNKILSEEHRNTISNLQRRHFLFTSPNGEIIEEFTTLMKFGKKYGLDSSCLSKVLRGKLKQHKGWKVHQIL